MVKKRERPPKSPNPNANTSNETQKRGLDLLELDEDDMADIDGLSPKQAEKLLKNLDLIHAKLKEKTPVVLTENLSEKKADDNQALLNTEEVNTRTTRNPSFTKPPSVWDSFDITKLRNAGEKLSFVQPAVKEEVTFVTPRIYYP
ncbi:hypothetical protein RIF29_14361 [Crotalaria pallida]|uniref:Uncharacterized protein n=1 Tax=Crotalaria pallida TaxID=3830 RepID=A0AAN9FB61_CROPI